MQEYTTPSTLTVGDDVTTITRIQQLRRTNPTMPVFRRLGDSGHWLTVTAQ